MKINLLPPEMQQSPSRYKIVIAVVLLLICVIAPVVQYSLSLSRSVKALAAQRDTLQARANKLQALDLLLKERASLEQELRRIEGEPIPERIGLVQYMDELARLLPDSLFITDLSLDEARLSLKGVTPTYALAAEFLKVLAGSSLFEFPSLSFLRSDSGGHTFEVIVQIRMVKGR